MTPHLGIEPGRHWWEASALTTAPALLPVPSQIVHSRLQYCTGAFCCLLLLLVVRIELRQFVA